MPKKISKGAQARAHIKRDPESIKKRIEKTNAKRKQRKERFANKEGIEHVVDAIFEGKSIEEGCPHALIGAASFRKMITGRFTVEDAHGQYKGFEGSFNNLKGAMGESMTEWSLYKSNTPYFAQPFVLYRPLPFICAKCDFIVRGPEQMVVEVKTSTSQKQLLKYLTEIPEDEIIQIWIQLECSQLTKAVLNVYELETQVNPVMKTKGVIRLHMVWYIVREAPFFTRATVRQTLKMYLPFFRHYLQNNGFATEPSIMDRLKRRFLQQEEDTKVWEAVKEDRSNRIDEVCANIMKGEVKVGPRSKSKPMKSEDRRVQEDGVCLLTATRGYHEAPPRTLTQKTLHLTDTLRNTLFAKFAMSVGTRDDDARWYKD